MITADETKININMRCIEMAISVKNTSTQAD